MMEIKVLCPSCKKQLKAPAQMAGKQAKCPHCQAMMLLPAAAQTANETPPPPTPPVSNIANLLDEEEDYRLAAGPKVSSPFEASSSSGNQPRRPCPMCGEMISVSAAKCRFCQAVFDEGMRRSQKKEKKSSGYSSDGDSDLSVFDWVIAILCSGIGCIVGIVYMVQGKPKGGKMIGVSLTFIFIWNVISFLSRMAQQGGGMGN